MTIEITKPELEALNLLDEPLYQPHLLAARQVL